MRLVAGLACIVLAGCGGGGSDGGSPIGGGGPTSPPPAPPPTLSPGGAWFGVQRFENDPPLFLEGAVTEDGRFHFLREDGVQFVGEMSVQGSSASGSYRAALPFGESWADGSNTSSGSVSLTIAERESLSGTFTFQTGGGTSGSGTVELDFDPIYERPSSLAIVAGNYTRADAPGTDSVNVNSNGELFFQEIFSTCIANGQVSVIDSRFNLYDIEYTYANCTGQDAILNGVTVSGIGGLDNTVSPELFIAGLVGTVSGVDVAAIFFYQRN